MNTAEIFGTLNRLLQALHRCGLRFHLTGGLASSFYGEPRFTQDIDIVVKISSVEELEKLSDHLEENFYIDRISARDGLSHGMLFQALDNDSMLKIDFHVGEAIPGELARSVDRELFPGIFVPLVSIEDSILSKLIWIKKGSHKSRADVQALLKSSYSIDHAYLSSKMAELNLQDIVDSLEDVDL